MKVDEKMIEAIARELARMDCDPLLQSEISIGLYADKRWQEKIEKAERVFTAMLSAAPTDYAELVERLRDRTSSGQCFTALLDEAADAIELLSARGSR